MTATASLTTAGRVLIIEEDDAILEAETRWLQHAGWEVSTVPAGETGLAIAIQSLPEVIICNSPLPDLDGTELIARLRASPSTAHIAVVLVIASSESSALVAGLDAGAHDCLVKPFEMIELEVRCGAALRVSRAQRRLRESERELRVLADNVSELVIRTGLDGVIRYASPSARRTLGWEPQELIGRGFVALLHPDDPQPYTPAELTASEEVTTVTRRVARADGTFVWLETRACVVEGPNGALEILSASRDVTERIATAAALAESEAAYRRIVDLAAEGILVVDADQVITYANERMAVLLSVTAVELIGRTLFEFMHDEDREIAAARIERRRAGIAEAGDFKFLRADGTTLWTSLNAAPILDDHGVHQGSIALVSDVTDRHDQEEALARSEARYRALLDHLPDTIAIVYDSDLRVIMAAGAGLAQRGFDPNAMIGKHFDDLVAAEDAPTLRPIFEAGFAGRTTTLEFFSRLTQVDNLLDIVPINDVPNTTGTEILVLAHDIGPIKQRERALAQAEARWRTAFEVAPVGMAQLGLDGRFSRVNPALCEMIGYPAEQLLTMTPADICHPDEAGVVGQAILDVAAGRVERLSTETRYVHADGHILWCAINAVPVHDDDGRVDHFLAHCLDITARKQMETELQQLSVRDPLTGLLNRRGFDDALLRQIAHVDRYGPDGALLILDLDGLKRLNDTQGHDAGDHALVATADLLRRRLRATDTLARLGGDEFAIILSHVDRLQANTTADSIVRTIRQHGTTHPTTYPITASIGVALFTTDGARDVVARADAAMYIAKRAGRDQVAMSGPDPQLAQAGGKPRDH